MKIAVGIERLGGCEYVRAYVPMLEMQRRGHAVAFADKFTNSTFTLGDYPPGVPIAMTLSRGAQPMFGASAPDVLFIQRLNHRGALENFQHLQARGTKIVYDLDDNFHAMPSHNPNAKEHHAQSEKTKVQDEFVRMCDLFTVSTPGMADEYARIRDGRPMAICPNALDDKQFEKYARAIDGAPKRDGQIRIGWAGSGTHVGDLRMVLPALCAIMDEFPQVQIVFVGADLRPLFGERYYKRDLAGGMIKRAFKNRVEYAGESYPGSAFTLTDLVSSTTAPLAFIDLIKQADFDIAIAPIEPNTFNRSKSWIKALEYGMLGLPMVLSNFGPYREFVLNGGGASAYLADGKREWIERIGRLIQSADMRRVMGNAAREHVGRHHLIHTAGDAWENALRAIVAQPEAITA